MPAPGQQAQQNSAANVIQQNQLLRQALLASAPAMRKNLGTITGGALGNTSKIKLFNVGVTTRILLDVAVNIDISTSTATPSPKAPFNLINRVKLTDYDGTDRVNCSGYQLYVWNSVRRRMNYGYNNGAASSILPNPAVPTAVGTNQQFRFQIEIPLAFDPKSDLRGSLLTQTAVGEAYINIDWNNLLFSAANADAVYNAGTAVALSSGATISVTAYQEYLLPQPLANGQVPIPTLDVLTVYEFAGALRSSDNLAAGQEKLINYPNVRSVIGCYVNYVNNGVMNAAPTDVAGLRLIANGNNVFREYGPNDKLFEQRVYMLDGSDLRAGTYFEEHRQRPIETALYGNVQLGFKPLAVNGTPSNTNLEIGFESFYTKGSTLPGLSQASG